MERQVQPWRSRPKGVDTVGGPFWDTPKLQKEGKNVAPKRSNAQRFSS